MAWVNLFEQEAWTFARATPLFGLEGFTPVAADAPASIALYTDVAYGIEHHYIAPVSSSTSTALGYTIGSPDAGAAEPYRFCISPVGGVAGRLFRMRMLDAGIPQYGGNGWRPTGDIVVGTGTADEFTSFSFPAQTISFPVGGGNVDTDFIEFTGRVGANWIVVGGPLGGDIGSYTGYFELQAWVDDPDPPEEVLPFSQPTLVHELDKGWSFDGNYIPHFLELNWLFMEDPVTYKTIQKIRIHGLVKGVVNLQVSLAGMQGDATTDYISDYMQPQFIDFPFAPIHISSEFLPATNYVDYSDRGLALQMKFEGRNTDITQPEPAHVIQVLALQSSPQGNGKRAD